MIVVADTSPLISLAVIDKLEILDILFGKIVIPEAVWQELEKYAPILSIPQVMKYQKSIIHVRQQSALITGIDRGESEAIRLFEEIHADQLLIDDNEARIIAESRSIPCLGTLGVLMAAKDKKLIPKIRPLYRVVPKKPASPPERTAPGTNLEAAGTLCLLRHIA